LRGRDLSCVRRRASGQPGQRPNHRWRRQKSDVSRSLRCDSRSTIRAGARPWYSDQIGFLIRAACMSDKEIGSGERHQARAGGGHIVIRRFQPEDKRLYSDFLRDVSAEDLRLRFFARVRELSTAESDKLSHLDYSHEMAFIALDEITGQMLGLVRLKD